MASLDWTQCPAVESIPEKVGGAWVFKGTRLPVATVMENLEDLSVEEVMAQFDVTRAQITAVLDFIAQNLRDTAPPHVRCSPMHILFDHGTPRGLASALTEHSVTLAYEKAGIACGMGSC
jgi:uncharacterized protein (DUF433 family)